MKVCEFPECTHTGAKYFMGWSNGSGKRFGFVCATHDKLLGRQNLQKYMSIELAIRFEKYLAETVDLEAYPDFPEWLEQHEQTHKALGELQNG